MRGVGREEMVMIIGRGERKIRNFIRNNSNAKRYSSNQSKYGRHRVSCGQVNFTYIAVLDGPKTLGTNYTEEGLKNVCIAL